MANTTPDTPATRALKAAHIAFASYLYPYEDHGGASFAARFLNLPEHAVIKTLVMENENAKPLLVLMHGDRDVATKQLALATDNRQIHPCKPDVAQKHTGYQVGGTSPFGTRKPLPVFIERSILDLPLIYINGGKRGFLVALHPHDLVRALSPTPVSVAKVTGTEH
ncbi:MAG TPA: aminoacyl-tRNA deacylase [Denitromonas sp.]|uniref:aminoacyl-tRNA deacylase n=1 Tax=Denitromonas sp. TaxID=2734609 RepID=UPI001DABD0CE|nr:aminoacyl-tRNA deacylase [Rhodocyclaceae bacterium]MCP5221766.1 aminoacyl-tRNA deacylase [Zoogloeaceae bacterium]HPR06047.1 aminoacyl-tRNA deacylase [Denitromonas sp.]HQU89154.1 aminoacyl-tRNA deacylase [Denitromonas sp.]HQV15327.1 aminoacyl-tRNA deacylase [Denitromonas sp.]